MGRFHTWIFISFALMLSSLFFIQIKNRLSALTQVLNTVSVSIFIIALTQINEYAYAPDLFLSAENKRILLFAAFAHFLTQYFLFFKRNVFSPWWSFFGQITLWTTFLLISAQNVILLFGAYFLMSLCLFVLFARTTESTPHLGPSSYLKQVSTLFIAGLSLILYVLSTQTISTTLAQPLASATLCMALGLMFLFIIFESQIFPLGHQLLGRWTEEYSHSFYALFIIHPALLWGLTQRFHDLQKNCIDQKTLTLVIMGTAFTALAFCAWKSLKSFLVQERISLMLKINILLILSCSLFSPQIWKSTFLAFSFLSVSTAAACLHVLFFRKDFLPEIFEGLFYKNKVLTFFFVFFVGSLAGFPLTSGFYFHYKIALALKEQPISFLILQGLGLIFLLVQTFLLYKTVFKKTQEETPIPFTERYRFVLVGVLTLATLYGGFWSLLRL